MKKNYQTLKKNFASAIVACFSLVSFNVSAQYCTTNLGGGCGSGHIEDFSILNTPLNNLNTGCTSASIPNYSTYPATGSTTATLNKGATYLFKGRFETQVFQASVWLDFDKNGIFDASEYFQWSNPSGASSYLSVTVPSNAVIGTTGLRVRSRVVNYSASDACGYFGSGETEDYTITIAAGANCTGAPIAGVLSANKLNICPNTINNLVLLGTSGVPGVTYALQTSTNGTTWVGTGDSTLTYTDYGIAQGDSIYYRYAVACNTGAPVYSNVIKITTNVNFYECYCNTNLNGSCFNANITNVNVVGTPLNNTSTCTTGFNFYYPSTTNTTASLQQAVSYTLLVNAPSALDGAAWLDLDHSGTFDSNEYYPLTFSGNVGVANVFLPSNAILGKTGMRVRTVNGTFSGLGSNSACSNIYGGEIEDYVVTIIAGTPCTGTPLAGTLNLTDTAVCQGSKIQLVLKGNTQAVGITTEWESSDDGMLWTLTGDTLTNLTVYGNQDSIYYRVKVACNGNAPSYSSIVKIKLTPSNLCYCTNSLGGFCGSAQTNSFAITGTSLSNLNSGCGATAGIQAYTKYPPVGSKTAMLTQAVSYTLPATFDFNTTQAAVWIDYNQDGIFDATEYVKWAAPSGNSSNLTLVIASNAKLGKTGMRVRSSGSTFTAQDACNYLWNGETEDYTVTIAPGVPCSGTPVAGVLSATKLKICPATNDTLTLTGATIAVGVTYDWEESTNGTTWTSTGDTTFQIINYGLNANDSIYYRVKVKCANGGSVYTNVIKIVANTNVFECYCTTNLNPFCNTFGGIINNVSIVGTTINNTTGCNLGYELFIPTTSTTTDNIQKGINYVIKVTAPQAKVGGVWIDYNKSGTFDVLEFYKLTFNGNVGSAVINLPIGAVIGKTGMRVRTTGYAWLGIFPNSACLDLYGNETEDYVLNIVQPVPCSGTPVAGTINVTDTVLCQGKSLTLTLSGTTLAQGVVTEWETSFDGTTGWIATLDSLPAITFNVGADSLYYRVKVTCNGSAAVYSNITKVKENPAYACYCSQNLNTDCDPTINNVTISGTTLNNTTGCDSYKVFYPQTTSTTANLKQAISYTVNVTAPNSLITGVWIDFDQSGSFDSYEYTNLTVNGGVGSASIFVPATATTGFTGMRVRTSQYTWGGLNGNVACGGNSVYGGEVEDYVINILPGTPCSGAPTAGNIAATSTLICFNDNNTISLTGNTQGLNISTAWQTSTDGLSWAGTGDSTLSIIDIAPSDSIYYRVAVSCNGSAPAYTNIVKVKAQLSNLCYCKNLGGGCASNTSINDVSIVGTTLSNLNTGCANNSYTKYPIVGNTTASLTQTGTYSLLARFDSSTVDASVWIDYDQSGTFDGAELVSWTNPSITTSGVLITVPFDALTGITGMRVRARGALFFPSNLGPCTNEFDGETEDYFINILPATPCLGTPVAGILSATATVLCPNDVASLSILGTTIGLNIHTAWQESTNGVNWTNTGDSTVSIQIAAPADSMYYRVIVDCNNGTPVYSNVIKIKLNTNHYGCYCKSQASYIFDDDIGAVTIGTYNNIQSTQALLNPVAVNTYTNYTGTLPIQMQRNVTTPVTITQINSNSFYRCYATVFIDGDHNGTFDLYEEMYADTSIAGIGGNIMSGTITIPTTTLKGLTGLRIVLQETGNFQLPPPTSCGSYDFGETEDYLVNISDSLIINAVAKNANQNVEFVAYPNPTMDVVTIALQGATTEAVRCEVLNVYGQVVYTHTSKQLNGVEQLKVDLSNYASGNYLIRVVSNNNVTIKKVVLQR
jgi:hypothetical protein